MRRIAAAGPAAGEAVRTVNHLPAAALAGSATVAYLLWRRRSKRGASSLVSAETSYETSPLRWFYCCCGDVALPAYRSVLLLVVEPP